MIYASFLLLAVVYLYPLIHTPTYTCKMQASTSTPTQETPQSLMCLMKEPTYTKRKQELKDQRKKFKDDPKSVGDLKAYENSEEGHEFTVL